MEALIGVNAHMHMVNNVVRKSTLRPEELFRRNEYSFGFEDWILQIQVEYSAFC